MQPNEYHPAVLAKNKRIMAVVHFLKLSVAGSFDTPSANIFALTFS